MRLYEGLFLFDANLASRDWPGLEKHVEEVMKKNSAEIVFTERWPDRKLSYEVKGCRKGVYYLTYFNAPTTAITALERDVQLSDRILRVLILQNEYIGEVLENHLKKQAEAAESEKSRAAAGKDGNLIRPVSRLGSRDLCAPRFVVISCNAERWIWNAA